MDKKFSLTWSGVALWGSLAVCLTAVGVGGWHLLFREPAAAPVVYEAVLDETPQEPVWQPQVKEEELPVAEVIAPVEQEVPAMPEIDVEYAEIPVVEEKPTVVVRPLEGEVVAAFSVSELQYDPTFEDWRVHAGVDLAAELGEAVRSCAAGTVEAVEEDALMGVCVTVAQEDGYRATYANLAPGPQVMAGQEVSPGTVLGYVGKTAVAEVGRGPHLHFALTKDGDTVNPEDYWN